MIKWFLVLAMGLISVTAFADFTDETCQVKSMYNGEKFDSNYKGTFGVIKASDRGYRIIYHSTSPRNSFRYEEGIAGVMPDEALQDFLKEWCPLLFSNKKCSQIKKVEMIESEKSEGMGFFHFLDGDNNIVGRAAGMAGLFGICR